MKKRLLALLIPLVCAAGSVHAQRQTITGVVTNAETQQPLPAVSVSIKGATGGTYTDDRGRFRFTVNQHFPLTIVFSSIGFESKEMTLQQPGNLTVALNAASTLGEEVVVNASRMVQRKLTAPVTIEQLSRKEIQLSPQLNYIDALQGLRGVDVTVSSLGFTSITTRGFNTSGNTNFTQIVDGMDNQAPGLNFPLGSVISPTQLDVDNIELLSGASSALYGSRGLNGTMVTSSKNPFKDQGLSFLITQGINHINGKKYGDPVKASPYYDWSLRWAQKLSERFAYKMNFQYTKGNDWVATDSSNKSGPGSKYTDPNYNGINYYGGATSVDIVPFMQGALQADPSLAPLIEPFLAANPSYYVARTGYAEYDYLNNNAYLFKGNAELRYKLSSTMELIGSGTFGTGNIVYTNDTRYQIRGFKVGQYRLELKANHWFVRGYATTENSGRTLLAGPTAQYLNEAWKPSYNESTGDGWYPQYTMGLLTAMAGGADLQAANLAARSFADEGRVMPGTSTFNRLKDSIANRPISEGGTLFLDRSKLYNAELQYNFSELVKFMNLIAGVNYRLYRLNSKNTLFPDNDKPINVNEWSVYLQASKKLIHDKLQLSASFRWDKNSLFSDAKVTSRLSSVFEVNRSNYIRFSYQNAYSFPSNIQALQNTLNGYNSYSSGGSNYLLNGVYHFDQYAPYTLESVRKYQRSNDPAVLEKFAYDGIKPQSVNAFELGYATVINKFILIDVLGYYATWKNFIGYANVANSPGTNDVAAFKDQSRHVIYNIAFNGAEGVKTYGYAASISIDFLGSFRFKANYYSDHIDNKNNKQVNNFNAPDYHINFDLGNMGFGRKKEWSFNTTLRYKPGYFYVVNGGGGQGNVPASAVMDAQISYKLLKAHSGIRLGGTNITNKYYSTGTANPMIGATYYITYAYNIF
ncbi:TonB-dependent receptor plug domain-containing protein [Pseudoflavitalea sp. G-6-1-2]|uniref:TonB-dependent receptor n=1 Tax=Pseudoflavitalea sp. G-6-1-2 TaxID=2728841 RepID=UPI00146BC8A5|nr:carboxypeptidase-like regulatory domain-containing protein [Pseudoflavitalea sp. G-6-1-2]NML22418.1 TonB-dependent receptor plug domain-containing protein [Pseudoflavitalea sp. G-6-1-2]